MKKPPHDKPYKPRGGTWRPTGRVLPAEEGKDTGQLSESARKPLLEILAEIGREEQQDAALRQKRAGITEPIKTGFQRDVDPELEEMLENIWHAGPCARELYVKISKGLATLTKEDVLAIGARGLAEIERLAPYLVKGATLKEAFAQCSEKEKGESRIQDL